MWKASPGLCDYVAFSGSYMDAFQDCVLRIYAGVEPGSSSADVSSHTLLCEIDAGGDPLGFEMGPPGVIIKDPDQVWSANELANGTATFFRLCNVNDDDSEDPDAIRIQGSVGSLSGDMILTNTTFATGSPRTIKHFSVVIPSI